MNAVEETDSEPFCLDLVQMSALFRRRSATSYATGEKEMGSRESMVWSIPSRHCGTVGRHHKHMV